MARRIPRARSLPERSTSQGQPPRMTARDCEWAGSARGATGCIGLFLAALLGIDALAGTLTGPRVALWTGLAFLLLAALWPQRVTVTPGRLATRGLLHERRVRTDHLVSVHCGNGIAQRLVLRDTQGGRVEIDPQVLVRNPPLWHLLDADARTSAEHGTLLCGESTLRELSQRVDRETARRVFKISGLE